MHVKSINQSIIYIYIYIFILYPKKVYLINKQNYTTVNDIPWFHPLQHQYTLAPKFVHHKHEMIYTEKLKWKKTL